MTETSQPPEMPPTKRPVLVWVISIFYGLGGAWSLFALSLILSGAIPIPDVQRDYFDGLTMLDHFFTVVISGANLIGAILLFCLRKHAFHFLLGAFAAGLILTGCHIIAKDWLAVIGAPGLFGAFIGWSINVAVIVYAKHLSSTNVLR